MRGRFEGRLLATLSALNLIHVNEYGNVRMAPTTFRCRENSTFIENHEDTVEIDQISASYAANAVARAIIQDSGLPRQRLKEVHLILLLSLGRSASTLVGEMLNRREGSLYIYEPCRALEKSQTLQDKGAAGCLALCARLLKCTFTSLDATIIFNDQQAVKQSQLLRPLIDVRKEKRFEVFQRVCEASSLRIVKEVRIVGDRIQEASPAEDQFVKMLRNPSDGTSFKILHIVRDPRGILNSRLKLPAFCSMRSPLDCAEEICRTMRSLLRFVDRVSRDEFGRTNQSVERLRYEDLAKNPISVMRHLYKWADSSTPSQRTQEWLHRMTEAPDVERTAFNIRRNASFLAESWHEDLPKVSRWLLESLCIDVNAALGYKV